MSKKYKQGSQESQGSQGDRGGKPLKKTHKKNKFVIIACIVGAVIIAASVFAVLQWNNITALRYRLAYSQEEINAKIDDNEQKIANTLSKTVSAKIRDLTDAERKLLANNDITKEEAVKLLVDDAIGGGNANSSGGEGGASGADSVGGADDAGGVKTTEELLTEPTLLSEPTQPLTQEPAPEPAQIMEQATEQSSPTTELTTETAKQDAEIEAAVDTDTDTNAESKLTELIAEAYVLRAYYTSRLEGMRASAAAEYKKLSADEKTRQNQMSIGMNYINQAGALEAECDGLMDNLIARIEAELKQTGGDTSVIGEIRSCYAEEKSLKKAYYMSLYS